MRKRLVAAVDPDEALIASYGRGLFSFGAKVTEGYAKVIGKGIEVRVPAEQLWDLVKSFARFKVRVGNHGTDYAIARNAADWLRQLAAELDAEAEAMPAWRKGTVGIGAALADGPATLWQKGYDEQMAWLRSQNLSKDQAAHSVQARLATVEDGPFNAGATEAIKDYIKELEAAEVSRQLDEALLDAATQAELHLEIAERLREELGEPVTYKIVRFYQDDRPREVIETGLTLEEAQAHCRREDTHGDGWFDGYEQEA